MKIKLHHRILILFEIAMLFIALPFVFSIQAEDVMVPTVYVNDTTAYENAQTTVSLMIKDFESYSALEISIYYDAELFLATSATYGYIHNSMPAHEKSYNINESGVVSYILATTEDTSINGTLLNINFSVLSNTSIGQYNINVAVVGAYNANQNSIPVVNLHGSISVIERPVYVDTIQYYSSVTNSNIQFGDTFVFKVYSYQLYQLATSNFEVYYNRDQLKLNTITMGSLFNQTNVLYDINDDTPGFINIAFATDVGMSSANPVLEVTFEVISNEDTSSAISFIPKNAYNEDMLPLGGVQTTRSINISKIEEVIDYPNIEISSFEGPFDESFSVDVFLEANTNLAAGDFVISYDASNVVIDEIIPLYTSSYFIYNHQIDQSEITFSILSSDGITDQTPLFTLKGHAVDQTKALGSSLIITGSNTVDKDLNHITIEYVSSTISLKQYYNVQFIDYDGTTLSNVKYPENATPTEPELNARQNTQFFGWDQTVSSVTQDIIYKAVYEVIQDNLTFTSGSFTYDGKAQRVEVTGLPYGSTVVYTNNDQIDVGEYLIEASIYLDSVYQFDLETNLIIEPRIVQINIGDHIMEELGEIPLWTYEVTNLIEGDDLNLVIESESGYDAGTHNIIATIDNENYTLDLIKGTLTVTPYPWIYGDLNYDEIVSVIDVATMQLYLSNQYEFSSMQEQIADVNLDGQITIEDIALIQLYIAESDISWPIHEIAEPALKKTYQSLQVIDTSELIFSDQTYQYNNQSQFLYLEGILPEGIKSIDYINCSRIDVGSQYGIVAFQVEDGYESIPNMVAKLTIEKTDITSIEFESLIVEYDGLPHQIELKTNETQYGETFNIDTDIKSFTLPGIYAQTITFTCQNYNDLIMVVDFEITKRRIEIEASNFDIIITSSTIDLISTYNNRVTVSIDGLNYYETNRLIALDHNTSYELSLYLSETDTDFMSNIISIKFITYYSLDIFKDDISKLSSIGLEDYDEIKQIELVLSLIDPNEKEAAALLFNQVVLDYNNIVLSLDDEYQMVKSLNVTKIISYASFSIMGLLSLILMRKKL